ncbi:hypothetical protein HDV00_011802 [Rhizophlyctis rosea]|nr:hypothetical protein HDV00_011802 [Rhizophlyctis rosea]
MSGSDFTKLVIYVRRKAGLTPRQQHTPPTQCDASRNFGVRDFKAALNDGKVRYLAYIASRNSFRQELKTLSGTEILTLLDLVRAHLWGTFSAEEADAYGYTVRILRAHLLPTRGENQTEAPTDAEVDRLLLVLRKFGEDSVPKTAADFVTALRDSQFTSCWQAIEQGLYNDFMVDAQPVLLEEMLSAVSPGVLIHNKMATADTIATIHRIRVALLSSLFTALCSTSGLRDFQSGEEVESQEARAKENLTRAVELLNGEAERKFAVKPVVEHYVSVARATIREKDFAGALNILQPVNTALADLPYTCSMLALDFGRYQEWDGVRWAWGKVKSRNPLSTKIRWDVLAVFVRYHLSSLPAERKAVLEEACHPLDFRAIDKLLQTEPTSCKSVLQTCLGLFMDWDMPDQAVDIFRLMQKHPETYPEAEHFQHMIQEFAKRNQVPVSVALSEDMEGAGLGKDVDVEAVSALIISNLRAKRRQNAYDLYRSLTRCGRYPTARAYTELVQAAIENTNWTKIWQLYREMIKIPGRLNQSTCYNIMAGIMRHTEGSCVTQIDKFWDEVTSLGVVPNIEMFNVVLAAHGRDGDVAGVERYLEGMKGLGLEWDPFTLDAVVNGHLRSGDYQRALDIYEERTAFGKVVPIRATVNRLIGSAHEGKVAGRIWANARKRFRMKLDDSTEAVLAKARMLSGEVIPKGKLSESGYRSTLNSQLSAIDDPAKIEQILLAPLTQPDAVTYTILIRKYLQRRDLEGAESVYQRMTLSPSTHPTAVTFLTLIKYCSDTGNKVALDHYMKEMERYITRPTLKIVTTLITGYSKMGDLEEAERWYNRMRELKLKPDTGVMNALLTARARANDFNGVFRFWADMRRQGLGNRVTYHILLSAYAKSSEPPSKALSLLRQMESHRDPNVRPVDNHPYTAVISAFGRKKDVRGAVDRYNEMLARGIAPSKETHNAMVAACAAAGDIDGAQAWFEQAFGKEGKGGAFEPDVYSYAPIIAALAEKGEFEPMEQYLQFMDVTAGIRPNAGILGVVLKTFIQRGMIEKAEEWFLGRMRMKSGAIIADASTIVSVVDELGEQGDIGAARRWFDRFTDGGVVANTLSYTSLIGAYAKARDIDGAMTVFEKMGQNGCKPNEVTFLVLIDCAAKANVGKTARKLFDMVVEARLPVREQLVVTLMDARGRGGDFDGVKECWQWLMDGVWPGAPRRYDSHRVNEAAASVFMDHIGRLSTYGELEETWNSLNQLPGHLITMNQRASYLEAMLRLGEVGTALRAVEKMGADADHVKIGLTLWGGLRSQVGWDEAMESFKRCTRDWRETTVKEVMAGAESQRNHGK